MKIQLKGVYLIEFLNDFRSFVIKKYCSIQSKFTNDINKYYGIKYHTHPII